MYFTKGTRTTNFWLPWKCSSTCNIVKWSNAQKIMFYTFFFNSNIIAAFSKSASYWRFDCLLSVRKYNVLIMMKLVVIWQCVEKPTKLHVCKTLVWKCRKMHQSCGKQTGLYGKISRVDKIDNNALKMYQTSTSFLPTLTFARSFHGILWQVFVHLHSFSTAF